MSMTNRKHIQEQRAADICGVSVETLSRFIETGYLNVTEGELLDLDDLVSLFGERVRTPLEEELGNSLDLIDTEEIEEIEIESPQPKDPEIYLSVIEAQEKLIKSEEERIKALEQERNWLRERVERLEDKSNRDQVLLMTEIDTLRNIVLHRPKTSVQRLLEWSGLVKSEQDKDS